MKIRKKQRIVNSKTEFSIAVRRNEKSSFLFQNFLGSKKEEFYDLLINSSNKALLLCLRTLNINIFRN